MLFHYLIIKQVDIRFLTVRFGRNGRFLICLDVPINLIAILITDMIRPKKLSATFVRTVTQPGRYGDGRGGHGLSLLVKPMANGRTSRSWSQRVRINGRETNVGLGNYPVVTLAEARQTALENKRAISKGHDPRSSIPTLVTAARKALEIHSPGWKDGARSAAIWWASMRDHVFPHIGAKRVDQIRTSDILDCLMPIWHEKPETARRVRQRISLVMRWCVARNLRVDNPAGEALTAVLPRINGSRRHFRSLPHAEVADAIRKVHASRAHPGTVLCFEFLVITATRSGEARLSRWTEIDWDGRTWTIPGNRTKTGAEHRVPLSSRALAILRDGQALSDGSGLVFPSARDRELSDATLSKLLRELGVKAVPHGFRSSFRDWCGESGVAREVAEACLAHQLGSKVKRAYARSDLFERRRLIMQQWADYLAG